MLIFIYSSLYRIKSIFILLNNNITHDVTLNGTLLQAQLLSTGNHVVD